METKLHAIKLNAGYTRNGQPKRLWIVMDADGDVQQVIKYDTGATDLPEGVVWSQIAFDIPGKEYKDILFRFGKKVK